MTFTGAAGDDEPSWQVHVRADWADRLAEAERLVAAGRMTPEQLEQERAQAAYELDECVAAPAEALERLRLLVAHRTSMQAQLVGAWTAVPEHARELVVAAGAATGPQAEAAFNGQLVADIARRMAEARAGDDKPRSGDEHEQPAESQFVGEIRMPQPAPADVRASADSLKNLARALQERADEDALRHQAELKRARSELADEPRHDHGKDAAPATRGAKSRWRRTDLETIFVRQPKVSARRLAGSGDLVERVHFQRIAEVRSRGDITAERGRLVLPEGTTAEAGWVTLPKRA